MKKKSKWLGEIPTHCDVCKGELKKSFVDGRTSFGPWAFMCLDCHGLHGCGLGLGNGQKYRLKDGLKLEG